MEVGKVNVKAILDALDDDDDDDDYIYPTYENDENENDDNNNDEDIIDENEILSSEIEDIPLDPSIKTRYNNKFNYISSL